MTMSTAEAHALSLQANGLLAELTRWQRTHQGVEDDRITDAHDGLDKATRALQLLAGGIDKHGAEYAAVTVSDNDPAAQLMSDEPIPLITADDA